MNFKCTGCGLCCQHVDRAVENTKHIEWLEFPYDWDDSGRCEKLNENNQCSVYEDRPLICNVEMFAEAFNLNKEEFYKLNEQSCIDLQIEEEK